jgi:hypothetical protein
MTLPPKPEPEPEPPEALIGRLGAKSKANTAKVVAQQGSQTAYGYFPADSQPP